MKPFAFAAAALVFAAGTVGAEPYDKISDVKPTDILSPELLKGAHHQVLSPAHLDGVIYDYDVKTPQGNLKVDGTERLYVRVDEIAALQKMEELKNSDAFTKALANAAKSPVNFAKDLVTDPIETVGNVASGVGSLFNNVGHALFGDPSEEEDNALKAAIGFDAIKRKTAFKFGVDAYSANPLLQERLKEISWASFAGGLPVKVVFHAVPGKAGTALSVTSFSHGMSKLVADTSPADLKELNQTKLKKMGVSEDVIELFLDHPKFSPTKKTRITGALEKLEPAAGRSAFISVATLTQDEPVAFFLLRQAELMAGYHAKVQKVKRLVRLGKLVFLRRADGGLVGLFPADHLPWLQRAETSFTLIERGVAGLGKIPAKEIWVTGDVSPLFRKNAEAKGWKIETGVRDRLRLD